MWGTGPLKSKRECLKIIGYKARAIITLFVILCSFTIFNLIKFSLSSQIGMDIRYDFHYSGSSGIKKIVWNFATILELLRGGAASSEVASFNNNDKYLKSSTAYSCLTVWLTTNLTVA